MERKKAVDFPQESLDLFDRYVHGDIGRREFLDGAKKFAVGGLTAMAIWESPPPELRVGATSRQRRRPNQGRICGCTLGPGQWTHTRVPGSSCERRWKVTGSAGGAREPRSESVY